MAKPNALVPAGEVMELLTLTELCRICGLSADRVIELVDEGILEPAKEKGSAWRFETTSITTVRKVQRLQADLRLNISGVAVVLSLADENARLKRRLSLLESDPHYAIRMPGPEE